MNKTIAAFLLLTVSCLMGQRTAYLAPGIWALCQVAPSSILCDVWTAQGKPVTYQLYVDSGSGDETVVAYSWSVTATLISTGASVLRQGLSLKGDVTEVSFGGAVKDSKITRSPLIIFEGRDAR